MFEVDCDGFIGSAGDVGFEDESFFGFVDIDEGGSGWGCAVEAEGIESGVVAGSGERGEGFGRARDGYGTDGARGNGAVHGAIIVTLMGREGWGSALGTVIVRMPRESVAVTWSASIFPGRTTVRDHEPNGRSWRL